MHPIAWLTTNDRWIPGLFVLGFAVMLAANGTMAWIAVGSFGGLATADYYDRGRTYNATLELAAEMAATGWSAELVAIPAGEGRFSIEARLAAGDGQPLQGAQVVVHFIRPSDDDEDFEVALEPRGNGLWQAEVMPPVTGLWQVRLYASRDDDVFASETRVVLTP